MGRNLNKRKRRGLLSSPIFISALILLLCCGSLSLVKLTTHPDLSWWYVFSPLLVSAAIVLLFFLLLKLIMLWLDKNEDR